MIILSLFDGMAGAYEAIERAGIKVDKYYCSEIDKYAHAVAKYNHPDVINLGDVNNWREWGIEKPDLIIGGFPCQAFSFAGKQLHFDDPRGQLFFRLLEIKEHYKPKFFLFENVKMKKDIQAEINNLLGVEPIEINSALLSAQNRRRNYWTNIIGVEQPADRRILLRDILESDSTGIIYHGQRTLIVKAPNGKNVVIPEDTKPPFMLIEARTEEGKKSRREIRQTTGKDSTKRKPEHKFYKPNETEKANCLVTSAADMLQSVFIDPVNWRKLTPLECERLQTARDGYTKVGNFDGIIKPISSTQRYKMLGNGFTIDVIAHILKYMKGVL